MGENGMLRWARGQCLNDEDLYHYITQSRDESVVPGMEVHLSTCPHCRQELAGLLAMLHPDNQETGTSIQEPTQGEIEEALSWIQQAEGKGPAGGQPWWSKTYWMAAAAAIVLIVGMGVLTLTRFFEEKRKTELFYAQGKSFLQEVYAPQSPNGLRLDLPFRSSARRRESASEDSLREAEKFFYQALALRAGMTDAHLGLGFIYLNRAQFDKAQHEFETVLNDNREDPRARLGLGASSFESGLAANNPLRRQALLESALADFELVLQAHPASIPAGFNEARTLFELGRHKAALEAIDNYLERDSDSIWAERLRKIQTRIRMNRSEAVEGKVDEAARRQDPASLRLMAQYVPYRVPKAIRYALERSLQSAFLAERNAPAPANMVWAAGVMESAYRSITGDGSYARLLTFYEGLSPPQRLAKKSLDARFRQLVDLHLGGNLQAAFSGSEPLIHGYRNLQDHWQLVRVYHLRGNCHFYKNSNLTQALSDYRNMLQSAERTGAPDLIAMALGTLAVAYKEQQSFDQALTHLTRMKRLAQEYGLEQWSAYASRYLGNAYFRLNQFEDSLREYSRGLVKGLQLNNEEVIVEVLDQLGMLMEKRGRTGEALDFYNQSVSWQASFLNEGSRQAEHALLDTRLNVLHRLGALELESGNLASAESYFREGLNASASGEMLEWEILFRLGQSRIFLRRKEFERAESELERVFKLLRSERFPEWEWQADYLEGRLARELGDTEKAREHFEHAIRILESMRRKIYPADIRRAFLSRRFDPYREMVALLFHSGVKLRTVMEYVDRAKSMTLREYLNDAPIRSGRLVPSRGKRIGESSSLLPAGFATLEYFVGTDEVFIFLEGPHGVETVSVPYPSSELEDQVQRYLDSIRNNDLDSFHALSRRLYDLLFEPILGRTSLSDVETLVILPDGPLHGLPMGALQDSSGRYLLQEYSLTYAPSRSILRYCLSLEKKERRRRWRSILLLDGTSNLRGASRELGYLARLFGSHADLLGARDLGRLAKAVQSADWIHFSGHATTIRGRPSLVFSSPRGDTLLGATTIAGWNLAGTYLVTLAGCNTGIGPRDEGETPWGLLPAFLAAGAPSVLVSLLPADDDATSELSRRFYDLLKGGPVTMAQALQQAQLALLENPSRGKTPPRPISWAPFVLVGDPR